MIRFSEFVSLGHPDKVADFISEHILDRYLERDRYVRYAVEVQIKDRVVTLGGEVSSRVHFTDKELAGFVAEAVAFVGYTPQYRALWGKENAISSSDLEVSVNISQQSPDIARGISRDGWGDQGIFFGYAERASGEKPLRYGLLPVDHYLAQRLCGALYDTALSDPDRCWGIDIKTQVVMDGDDRIRKVVVAIPLRDEGSPRDVENFVRERLGSTEPYEVIVNGTGRFTQHGPVADCGTTGRKLAVDFYGGNCRIGGGSPWTKDGTKADLTLNLYARELAVEASQRYERTCTASLCCTIGRKEVEYCIYDEANTVLESGVKKVGPKELVKRYNLSSPVFAGLLVSGLFGGGFPWETPGRNGKRR